MKHCKRILALLLTVALLLSLLTVAVRALTGAYSNNRAVRHTVCAALSAQALAYYTGAYSYETLTTLDGVSAPSDSWAATQNNPLYTALQTLMTDTHTNRSVVYSGYGDTALATYWAYTDSAKSTGSYLYFYTDIDAGSVNLTMNREHVWPKSKASYYQINGGADLHHLRPSVSTVNSAKSNYAFGNVRQEYSNYSTSSVNGQAVIWTADSMLEVRDNVKGDVARILLYVYCRWGQPNLYADVASAKLPPMDSDDSQNTGIRAIESLDTLLQWMAMDPVDEWEMNRNDRIEAIQGNRNVFIDYPELAWQLFGLDAPADMATPSGEAAANVHDWDDGVVVTAATCTEPGVLRRACRDCGITKDEPVPALGHLCDAPSEYAAPTCLEDGYAVYICSRCGEPRRDVLPASGHHFVDGICINCGLTVPAYRLTNELKDGDSVILYTPSASAAVSSGMMNEVYRAGESLTPEDNVIVTDSQAVVWTVKKSGNGFTLTGSDGTLLSSGTANSLDPEGSYTVWNVKTASTADCVYIYNNGEHYLEWSSRYSDYASYAFNSAYESVLAMQIYSRSVCAHANTESRDIPPACAEPGCTGAVYCIDCGARLSVGTTVPPTGHSYEITGETPPTCTENGSRTYACAVCGDSYDETLTASGHDWTPWQETAPTCTADGKQTRSCKTCGKTESKSVTAPGHDWGDWTGTAATCTADGTRTRACKTCGATETETLTAAGHQWGSWSGIPPTCTEDGEERRSCEACGAGEVRILKAQGHSEKATVVPPTCLEAGYTLYKCSRCGSSRTADETEPFGHDWDEGAPVPVSAAGVCEYELPETRLYTCRRCGGTEERFIEAQGCPCRDYPDAADPGSWYHSAADFVVSRGLMGSTRTDALTFEPAAACTRAMIVSVLYRLAGSPAAEYENIFPDVPEKQWYTSAVLWAYRNGIVRGYDTGSFGPNDKITREQLAVILKGYASRYGLDTSRAADLSGFADAQKATWSADGVRWAVAAGMISGKPAEGKLLLDPQGSASRAEAASILMRFVQFAEDCPVPGQP